MDSESEWVVGCSCARGDAHLSAAEVQVVQPSREHPLIVQFTPEGDDAVALQDVSLCTCPLATESEDALEYALGLGGARVRTTASNPLTKGCTGRSSNMYLAWKRIEELHRERFPSSTPNCDSPL
jgi:hypothetical protein